MKTRITALLLALVMAVCCLTGCTSTRVRSYSEESSDASTDKYAAALDAYKSNKKAAEVLAVTPLERILVETDSPYMAPEPCRGKRNDSSLLVYVLEKIAALKGVSAEEMTRITQENGCRLFGIKA